MPANSYKGNNDKVKSPNSPTTQQWLKKYVKDIEFNPDGKISAAAIDDSLEIKLDELFNRPVASLALQWARKYMKNIHVDTVETLPQTKDSKLLEIGSLKWRVQSASILRESLVSASVEAIDYTQLLLSQAIKRHKINPKLIDVWKIAADSCEIHGKILDVYSQTENPGYQVVKIGQDIGAMRQKYTAIDPRVIGVVSMQFYYTTQFLVKDVSAIEKDFLSSYFKVIDDYLYMPLHRCYESAANHSYDSPSLQAVRELLGKNTEIATKVFQRIYELNPNYCSRSGALNSPSIKASTIRDVEMFQVYLWLSVLEGNVAVIQQELLPICVMLYPILGVKWELVWQMFNCLNQEFSARLEPHKLETILPYFRAMYEIFSQAVLDDNALAETANS